MELKQKRVAVYLRVSTDLQDTASQLSILQKYASDRGFQIVGIYEDKGISGVKDSRPELDKLMNDARKRLFDAVLVFRFDRFARSLKHLVMALEEFRTLGVDFISYSENWDTTTPMGEAMFQIVGVFAQLERNIIRERIIAGLQHAKEKGRHIGRKPLKVDEEQLVRLRALGKSIRQIACDLNCSKSKIAALLKKSSEAVQKSSG